MNASLSTAQLTLQCLNVSSSQRQNQSHSQLLLFDDDGVGVILQKSKRKCYSMNDIKYTHNTYKHSQHPPFIKFIINICRYDKDCIRQSKNCLGRTKYRIPLIVDFVPE
mmetsp:Transcript_7100/g.10822  ORF Transcript_7100/g.10822 Transcript_7100/m.10822 type:complete len:109 (+) Transcript_7100:290-616(+)